MITVYVLRNSQHLSLSRTIPLKIAEITGKEVVVHEIYCETLRAIPNSGGPKIELVNSLSFFLKGVDPESKEAVAKAIIEKVKSFGFPKVFEINFV